MKTKEINNKMSTYKSRVKTATRSVALAMAFLMIYIFGITMYSDGMLIAKDMEAWANANDPVYYYVWHRIKNQDDLEKYLRKNEAGMVDGKWDTCKSPNPAKEWINQEQGTYEMRYQDWHRALILWGPKPDEMKYMWTRSHCAYTDGYYGVPIRKSDGIKAGSDTFTTSNNFHSAFMKFCEYNGEQFYKNLNRDSKDPCEVMIKWQDPSIYTSWTYKSYNSNGEGYVAKNAPMLWYHQNLLYGGASSANYDLCIETDYRARADEYKNLSCCYGDWERHGDIIMLWNSSGKWENFFWAAYSVTGLDVAWDISGKDHIHASSEFRWVGHDDGSYFMLYIATLEERPKYSSEVIFEDGVDSSIQDLIIDYETTLKIKSGATLHLSGDCQLLGNIEMDGGILIIEDGTLIYGTPAVRMDIPKVGGTAITKVSQISAKNGSQIFIGKEALVYLPMTCFNSYKAIEGGMQIEDSTVYSKGKVVLGSYLKLDRSTWQQSGSGAATYVGFYMDPNKSISYKDFKTSNLLFTSALNDKNFVVCRLNGAMLMYSKNSFVFADVVSKYNSISGLEWVAPPISRQTYMKKYSSDYYTTHRLDSGNFNQIIKDYSFEMINE